MLAILHLKEQFSHSFRSLLQICLYEIQSATKAISRCISQHSSISLEIRINSDRKGTRSKIWRRRRKSWNATVVGRDDVASHTHFTSVTRHSHLNLFGDHSTGVDSIINVTFFYVSSVRKFKRSSTLRESHQWITSHCVHALREFSRDDFKWEFYLWKKSRIKINVVFFP